MNRWHGTWKMLRPHHWTKNGLCLAGVLFGPRHADHLHPWLLALATVGILCVASSAVYVLNDILDRKRDRMHPRKSARPVAGGAVSVGRAAAVALALGVVAIGGAWALGRGAFICACLYLANGAAYCLFFKHMLLIDVFSITFGHVLRLLAGIYVLGDLPTTWITLCTFFLAAFLGFSKRRAELSAMDENSNSARRPVLDQYSVGYLDFLISSSATMAMLAYALFTVTSGKNPSLILTFPFVCYALMRYKQLVMVLKSGEEPEQVLVRRPFILVSITLWLISYVLILRLDVRVFG